jgi:RHS repeat-associated protein
MFSTYALSDADGTIVERYKYDAYGAPTVLDADWGADADGLSDGGNPYLFTGRRLDPAPGLMQYRNRYYDPGLGRFIRRDPSAYANGLCLYEYSASSPTVLLDPLGLECYGEPEKDEFGIYHYPMQKDACDCEDCCDDGKPKVRRDCIVKLLCCDLLSRLVRGSSGYG